MELRNVNANKTVNIPQRHFILTLHISAFPILLFQILIALSME